MSDEEPEIEEEIEEEEESDESEEEHDDEPIEEYCREDEPFDEKTEIDRILRSPNFIQDVHPQETAVNYEEVLALCTVIRDANHNITDPLHTSLPMLTKYEYARIIGMRATQIEKGAPLFIDVPDTMIDSYLIAKDELHQKKIPFIIKRPIPNGSIEYWKLEDLELLF